MRTMTLRGVALAVALAGVVGCAATAPPPVPKPPPPVDYEKVRREEAARFQQRVVMGEVARTHPVLSATLDRDMQRLRAALAKAPAKVNEVRRDMRLGPPLREACRLRWSEGITELLERGGKCLGDSQCESCVRGRSAAPVTGGAPPAPRPATQGLPPPKQSPTQVLPPPRQRPATPVQPAP